MDAALKAAAVICAAGSSSRMCTRQQNGDAVRIKKEYQKLNDKEDSLTVLGSSVAAFSAVPSLETIIIAVPKNDEAAARAALGPEFLTAQRPEILFVEGGKTRRASVFNALSVLVPYKPDYVLIHDGARPWVSPSLIERIIESVKKYDAVIPLLPMTETPKECEAITGDQNAGIPAVFIKRHLKRANMGIAQTPQAFNFLKIMSAHEQAAKVEDEEFTDDAEVWSRFCGPVAAVPGDQENKKITFKEDLLC
jgi:2-C-methyl-D-erythritol 4-phosphate cytidylyltransferase